MKPVVPTTAWTPFDAAQARFSVRCVEMGEVDHDVRLGLAERLGVGQHEQVQVEPGHLTQVQAVVVRVGGRDELEVGISRNRRADRAPHAPACAEHPDPQSHQNPSRLSPVSVGGSDGGGAERSSAVAERLRPAFRAQTSAAVAARRRPARVAAPSGRPARCGGGGGGRTGRREAAARSTPTAGGAVAASAPSAVSRLAAERAVLGFVGLQLSRDATAPRPDPGRCRGRS